MGSLRSVEPVKYPLRCTASLQVPFSVQCQAAIRSSVLLRYVIGPQPAESASWMMCGVYTLLMSVRERTSIELPSALSGSNVLISWPGVASTRTVWAKAGGAGQRHQYEGDESHSRKRTRRVSCS